MFFHQPINPNDVDAAEEVINADRDTLIAEKKYDDERQRMAFRSLSQTTNSLALISSQSITIQVFTAQGFVSYFFVFVAIIFVANMLKNLLYTYKDKIIIHAGSNLYDVAFQYLTIIGLFFFYLMFTLVRMYFEINQRSIPFIAVMLGVYIAINVILDKDIQRKKII